jgi:anti-sigma factor RsiW
MLAITREHLLTHLLRLSAVVDRYTNSDPAFAEHVARWLSVLEDDLGRLRSPIASLASSQRAGIVAAGDGRAPAGPGGRSISKRKARAVAAATAMAEVERALREQVQRIDKELETHRDKLAQLIAVFSQHSTLELPAGGVTSAWLDDVWRGLANVEDTRGMYDYLAARLTAADRRYLLAELFENILDNVPVQT